MLYAKVLKLAHEVPALRRYLVPLLRFTPFVFFRGERSHCRNSCHFSLYRCATRLATRESLIR